MDDDDVLPREMNEAHLDADVDDFVVADDKDWDDVDHFGLEWHLEDPHPDGELETLDEEFGAESTVPPSMVAAEDVDVVVDDYADEVEDPLPKSLDVKEEEEEGQECAVNCCEEEDEDEEVVAPFRRRGGVDGFVAECLVAMSVRLRYDVHAGDRFR